MQHESDAPRETDAAGGDPESDDLVARARAAVVGMRRQAAAGGLDASSEADDQAEADSQPEGEAPGEGDLPAPKPRRKKKGAGRAA